MSLFFILVNEYKNIIVYKNQTIKQKVTEMITLDRVRYLTKDIYAIHFTEFSKYSEVLWVQKIFFRLTKYEKS